MRLRGVPFGCAYLRLFVCLYICKLSWLSFGGQNWHASINLVSIFRTISALTVTPMENSHLRLGWVILKKNILQVHMHKKKILAQDHRAKKNSCTHSELEKVLARCSPS